MAQQQQPAPAKKAMKNPLDSILWTVISGVAILIVLVIIIRIAAVISH